MNTHQVQLVQQTFELAAPRANEVADRFYQRLFALDPSLRPLFPSDLSQQGDKLMTVLAFAVRGLNQPEAIIDAVRRLGQRHVGYGVQPHHYQTVGEALLWTLAQMFGPAFTDEIRQAWAEAYQLLANVMLESVPEPA